MKLRILSLDDDPQVQLLYRKLLAKQGDLELETASTLAEALAAIKNKAYDIALVDLRLQGDATAGFSFLRALKALDPSPDCIVVSAERSFEAVLQALREGADDYITKGFSSDELAFALEKARLRRQWRGLEKRVQREQRAEADKYKILGESTTIRQLRAQIDKLGDKEIPILIQGETGTGKELVARNLHLRSSRSAAPFIALDCTNIPASMAEGFLFGHDRGAFTGAEASRPGIFEQANGGTLFLDEVGVLPLELQAKFLRVLQEKEFCRLGSTRKLSVEFRLVSAANQNLEEMVRTGKFKEDLFYRLNGLLLHVPPLRERKDDLETLLLHYLPQYTWAPSLLEALKAYAWPGNIRELRNICQALEAMSETKHLRLEDLPEAQLRKILASEARESNETPLDFHEAKKLQEKEFLSKAYRVAGGNISAMARTLKLDRSHLHQKLKDLGIHEVRS